MERDRLRQVYFNQDTLSMSKYLPKHMAGAGQVLNYAMTQRPHSVIRQMLIEDFAFYMSLLEIK